MKTKKVFIVPLFFLSVYVFLLYKNVSIPIESISIPSISVIDTKNVSNELYYIIDTLTYNYKQNSTIKKVNPSVDAITPGEARHNYNLKSKGYLFPGLQKVLLFGENICYSGIDTFITMVFSTSTYNDTSQCAVITIPGKTFLDVNLPGNDDIAEFTEGLLKNCKYDNFFSDNYKLMDVYYYLANEGYNLCLPHIRIEDSQPSIDGMVIFKKDKIAKLLDLNESKIMNLLRESDVVGNIYLKDSNTEILDCTLLSKRKVYCDKIDDKYFFTIKLSARGEVYSNSIYDKLSEDQASIDEVERRIEEKLIAKCNGFIHQMQNNYKVDCLNLGKHILAKEGFNKDDNIDYNELVCNSEIKVVVDLLIETFGRGDF